jgi:hypothetical protein
VQKRRDVHFFSTNLVAKRDDSNSVEGLVLVGLGYVPMDKFLFSVFAWRWWIQPPDALAFRTNWSREMMLKSTKGDGGPPLGEGNTATLVIDAGKFMCAVFP